MKTANLIIAIVYSTMFGLLIAIAARPSERLLHPYRLAETIFFLGPIILNWLTVIMWNNIQSTVKQANGIVASIYTLVLIAVIVEAAFKGDVIALLLGGLIVGVPIALNWMSYVKWPN